LIDARYEQTVYEFINKRLTPSCLSRTHLLVVGGDNAARAGAYFICIAVRAAANESSA
jgi:hypothetical protein